MLTTLCNGKSCSECISIYGKCRLIGAKINQESDV